MEKLIERNLYSMENIKSQFPIFRNKINGKD